jgi:predicted negative regulator of RcsB-dependent stress response
MGPKVTPCQGPKVTFFSLTREKLRTAKCGTGSNQAGKGAGVKRLDRGVALVIVLVVGGLVVFAALIAWKEYTRWDLRQRQAKAATSVQAAQEALRTALRPWDDAYRLVISVPRLGAATPLANMQQAMRAFERHQAPKCLRGGQAAVAATMASDVELVMQFVSQQRQSLSDAERAEREKKHEEALQALFGPEACALAIKRGDLDVAALPGK